MSRRRYFGIAHKMGIHKRLESERVPQAEDGLSTQEAMAQYEKLVQEVRMRQHDLGNQLSALKSISSVDAERYLEELNKDQRHNVLLLCGDPLLAGLLYQKCREAEAKGITVESHVSARLGNYALLQHELVAIVGGLLDNAIDAELARPEEERHIHCGYGGRKIPYHRGESLPLCAL